MDIVIAPATNTEYIEYAFILISLFFGLIVGIILEGKFSFWKW